jgi:translation initiation factor 3 subunit E
MAEYDLTFRISKHLDKHLALALLQFLADKKVYEAAEIEAARLQLIEKTNMVDYAGELYQSLHQTEEASDAMCPEAYWKLMTLKSGIGSL